MAWDAKVDAFAVGCVITEVWTGMVLFPATDNVRERIAAVHCIAGPIRPRFVERWQDEWSAMVKIDGGSVKVLLPCHDVQCAVRRRNIQRATRVNVGIYLTSHPVHLTTDPSAMPQRLDMDDHWKAVCADLLRPDPLERKRIDDVA